MAYAERKMPSQPAMVPEGEADDMEPDEKLLMKNTIKLGLSTIEPTADGKNFAYVRLDLQGRSLRTLSGELGSYRELRHVNLASNELSSGLETLALLPHLVTLTVQRNKLSSLPDLSSCKQLQIVQADYNEISSLQYFRAPSLFAMTLSRNKLATLADVANPFPCVESLDLSFNALASLAGVEAFPNIRHLNVSRNAVTSLAGVQALQQLQSLDVSHNKLSSIAEFKALAKLPSLTTLIVGKNPGLKRSAAALAAGADAGGEQGDGGEGAPPVASVGEAGDLLLELLVLLPRLQCIDSHVITAHERVSAAALKRAREEEAAAELAVAEGERAVAAAEAKAAAAEKAMREAEAKRDAARGGAAGSGTGADGGGEHDGAAGAGVEPLDGEDGETGLDRSGADGGEAGYDGYEGGAGEEGVGEEEGGYAE